MGKSRVESFSDCVLSIIITIMVLEMKAPQSTTLADLLKLLPVFSSYVLSFLFLAIYWINHHNLLHAVRHVSGWTLWANVHLLFWLSLIPFTTSWMGNNPLDELPIALYGVVLLMCAASFALLQIAIIHAHGADATLAEAVGTNWKTMLSLSLYGLGIGAAFTVPWAAELFYFAVALLWALPDHRLHRALKAHEQRH